MQPEEEDVLRDSRRRPRSKGPSSQVGGGRHGPASPRPSLEPAEGAVRRGVAARLGRPCEATSVCRWAPPSGRPGLASWDSLPGRGGGCSWETAPGHRFQVAFVFLLEAVLLADLCPALAVGFGRPKGAPPGVTEPRESGRPGGGRVGRVRSRAGGAGAVVGGERPPAEAPSSSLARLCPELPCWRSGRSAGRLRGKVSPVSPARRARPSSPLRWGYLGRRLSQAGGARQGRRLVGTAPLAGFTPRPAGPLRVTRAALIRRPIWSPEEQEDLGARRGGTL